MIKPLSRGDTPGKWPERDRFWSVAPTIPTNLMRALAAIGLFFSALVVAAACSRGEEIIGDAPEEDAGATVDSGGSGGATLVDVGCSSSCSADGRQILDCNGDPKTTCPDDEVCHSGECTNACALADESKASVGCDYFAVNTDILLELAGSCFVAFVTNTFATPAHLSLSFDGDDVDLATYARKPKGAGADVTYEPYDPVAGLEPGEVAILFLSNSGGVACPIEAARDTGGWVSGTGWGEAFRIQSDVPVVAFQMLPYGGGSAAITGASLLLPTSAWGTNYIAVNAWPATAAPPSLNLVAMEDDTEVTILPRVAIEGRVGVVPSSPENVPITYTLGAGEFLQLTQGLELTGSPIQSNKKIALFGGSQCMYVPTAGTGYCDHAEQQIPPVQAMGHEYVAAHYRPRTDGETTFLYRLVGAIGGTALTYDPPVIDAPATLESGELVEVWSDHPFVVTSQDEKHPFLVFSYMTGGDPLSGTGDPDFVRVVPAEQYLSRYVFFTDPTYPETSIVVTRTRKTPSDAFADVTLDCKGVLDGWEPVGTSGLYETTRVDLVRHVFEPQGNCDNGSQEMSSENPFGVTVWSWGGPETTGGVCPTEPPVNGTYTCYVSYGYPAGESVRPVNDVIIVPVPK